MRERIVPRGGHFGIGGEIVVGVEFRDRTERAMPVEQIMHQRACGRQLVPLAVPAGIEQRRRVTTGLFTEQDVVQQGIEAGQGDVGIGGKVPARVKNGVRTPALPIAVEEEMREQILPGCVANCSA